MTASTRLEATVLNGQAKRTDPVEAPFLAYIGIGNVHDLLMYIQKCASTFADKTLLETARNALHA